MIRQDLDLDVMGSRLFDTVAAIVIYMEDGSTVDRTQGKLHCKLRVDRGAKACNSYFIHAIACRINLSHCRTTRSEFAPNIAEQALETGAIAFTGDDWRWRS